ncbi:hypothetical protein M404DRAFT_27545 [Pisolithus tinctorius Marx 270]|uniref:Uncharacterized protein n=1 Tax=Pisolithus tinctorius Marx 270 TaxID=870435 RepID=A0A0C3J1J3_PISTI|nr:hypothetical protein M404DRAFT_27545 [Pisolithus tinctorius Marx 270]
MSIHQSRTPYNQDLLPDLTWVMSVELQVGSDDDEQAIQGKLAECKRHKVKAQEEAWLEVERQEQAQLKEKRMRQEAEVQRAEAACKAEEARRAEESWCADALVGGLTGARSNVEVMDPQCLCCIQTNMACLHNTNSKKKHLACNQCNKLKECCQWLVEGETGPGAGLAVDKGKRKADVLKGADDEGEDVGEGPLTKKTSAEVKASPVTGAQMEHLINAVEHVADNVAGLVVAQKEVSQNFYWFTWSYETYIGEHFELFMPDMPSDWDTTNKEDRDVEGLEEELEGLREEEEGQFWSESGDQTGVGSTGSQV